MADFFPAVSFGPVGLAVNEHGQVLIVKDNTSELKDDTIAYAMTQAERSARDMGFVKDSEAPDEETFLFSSWVLNPVRPAA